MKVLEIEHQSYCSGNENNSFHYPGSEQCGEFLPLQNLIDYMMHMFGMSFLCDMDYTIKQNKLENSIKQLYRRVDLKRWGENEKRTFMGHFALWKVFLPCKSIKMGQH